MDLGEPEAPDAILARVPRQLAVDDIIGFDSRSRGPLLVLVGWEVTARDRTLAYVFDPLTGDELATFTVREGPARFQETPVHVYESPGGPVLVVAPEGEAVRQFSLPDGRPRYRDFEPGGRTHAVGSIGRDLVVADGQGWIRRFDATTGAPAGKPIRYGPSRWPGGRRDTLLQRPPRRMVLDGDLAVVTDRTGDLWRVDLAEGKAKKVPFRDDHVPRKVQHVLPDPLGRPGVVVIGYQHGDFSAAVCDTATGDPVYLPEDFGEFQLLDSMAAAAIEGFPMLFVVLESQLLGLEAGTGEDPLLLAGDLPAEFRLDLDVCVCPVGGRIAVFAFDGFHVYRYDAADCTPWPAPPTG